MKKLIVAAGVGLFVSALSIFAHPLPWVNIATAAIGALGQQTSATALPAIEWDGFAVDTFGSLGVANGGIRLGSVNAPPVNTVPGTQTTNEDVNRVFSSANASQISVNDPDDADNGIAGDEVMRETLTVTNGTLTLSGISGLTFTAGANGTATMTFTGTIGSINAALNGMSYTPTLNFNGAASLTITTNDLGNFGTGGPLTDIDSVTVNVTAVNDAPTNTVPGAQTTNEETARVFSSGNGNQISINDVDDADNGIFGDETLQETLTVTNGTLTLATTSGLTFTGGANGTAAMTFIGTRNSIAAGLNGMSYTPALNFVGSATLTVTTNDLANFGIGGALSDTDTVNITVNGVNDAPVNTIPGTQTTNEDVGRVFSAVNANQISVNDPDDADNGIAGDEVMRETLTATNGTLTLASTSGLTFTAGANGTATMTFTGTISSINAALNGMSYTPTLNFNGAASLTITTNDLGNFGTGGPLTDTDSVTINVNPVNDAPVNTVPGPQSTNLNTSLAFSSGNGNVVSLNDVDDADNGIVGDETLQETLTVTNGTLTLAGTSGLAFLLGDGTADATMTFSGSRNSIANALNGMSYAPTTSFVGNATLTVITNDLGNFGIGGMLTDTDTVSIAVGAPPTVQFSAATYMDDESQNASIVITRTGATTGTSSVTFDTTGGLATGGAACTAGVDYVAVTGFVVNFIANQTQATVPVTLCGDNLPEASQTINVALSNPAGSTLGTQTTAVVTINDTASQFRNVASIDINGGGAGLPDPSTISVTGGPAITGPIRVTLYDVSSTFADDVDVLLVGPNGNKYVLMGDAGGPLAIDPLSPVTLTFTDTAVQVLPDAGSLNTAVYKPTTWVTPVTNFPGTAPAGPYAEPGSLLVRPVEKSMFGSFGLSNSNGAWSLYVRDDSGLFAAAVEGNIAGGWGLEILAPTAAGATLSGRVTTADGRGISNARVTVVGGMLTTPRTAITGAFGYYSFEDLPAGQTYIATVGSKRFTFAVPARVISLAGDVTDADFVAEP
jgi:acyl dehydratase